ncbi:DUF1553 domain-containing protein [Larkinella terrae]|uniref:DUF1553 domain-containing protein n=1 Tax=Larkinella terrae TaxID=2025311 RepID=A0A7K0EFJ8_9BACT|nr:DUF1553 domain-containing protein [Larkinella terrae]MRS60594.1 DUF1553 domain-containing protein [Larkinella terrae]
MCLLSDIRFRSLLFSTAIALFSVVVWSSCGNSVEKPAELVAIESKLPEKVDYNLHIKPILSDRCFACHGPDKAKQKAGLRLDIAENAYEALSKSGKTAIVPGNLAKSEAYHRIISNDPEYRMPTPESNLILTTEEKALLVRWIEQGAEYKPHWSLITPQMADVPKVKNEKWARNEIDNFVLKKLEDKGLTPNPEADKATLLRRVTLDLTGLPPTVAEVDAFLADTSPNAYEKVVNRLFSSPHYGERQAVEWLDAARYADTHGYQDDGLRTMWPYRNWVITAFNKNLRFDKFISWQLAGDMLPNPTQNMLLATAFNRNHQQSQEGGIVDEEYRVEYVADRVNTFGKAMLGLTVECARCHDHKYDPISQKDYYSLFAFFNNNNERGQIPYNGEPAPTITLTSRDAEAKLNYIHHTIKPIQQRLNPNRPEYQRAFGPWLSQAERKPESSIKVGLVVHYTFDEADRRDFKAYENSEEKKLKDAEKKKEDELKKQEEERRKKLGLPEVKKPVVPKTREELEKDPRNAFWNQVNDTLPARLAGDPESFPYQIKGKVGMARYLKGDSNIELPRKVGFYEQNQPFTVSAWFNVAKPGLEGMLMGKSNGPFDGNRGYEIGLLEDGRFKITMNHVWPDNSLDVETVAKIRYKQWFHLTMTYDGSGRAAGIKLYLNGQPAKLEIITDHLVHSIDRGKNGKNWSGSPFLIGRIHDHYIKDYAIDELRIYNRSLTPLEIPVLAGQSDALTTALFTPAAKRTAAQRAGLYTYYVTTQDSTYQKAFAEFQENRAQELVLYNNSDQVMVMKERKYPRKTYLLKRGAYDAHGEEVTAATPGQLMPFPEEYPKNRLGLAMWLLNPDNSLFSRVMVNRFWQQYFGQGLVKTSDDFGNQGDLPSHPELLDYLAVRFRDGAGRSGIWNAKALQKLIVMSATYRQSSVADTKKLEVDLDNALLSRGPSYRMSAEQVRDNALAASGLLSQKIGGTSVLPYQPAGIWEALATRNAINYEQSHGDSLYRRSLYTIWKRSSPPPMMLNFDAAERHTCIVKRQKTSTPLQALVTLNDPQFVEAARVLGQRALGMGLKDDALIGYVFKSVTSRPVRPAEVTLMKQLYAEELADFRSNPKRAADLLSVGEFPVDKAIPASELAAWTVVTSTIMNVDEAIIKR